MGGKKEERGEREKGKGRGSREERGVQLLVKNLRVIV